MKKRIYNDVFVAVDIGTTKILVLIARKLEDHNFELLGIGKSPSHGLKKGVVYDISKTVRSIQAAVKEAELMADCQVDTATIGISGAHIGSLNSHGMVPIKGQEITQRDIDNVIAAARTVQIPEGQKILHVMPQYFMVDGGDRITDPHGMYGVRLEAQVHIITGSVGSVQNLVKCCDMAGLRVNDIVLEQLASAEAVLSADEKELGVGMLDIGGGTSDLALFQGGSIRHTMVLPVAGNHFTNDVAICLQTTLQDAERIKQEYGLAHDGLMDGYGMDIELSTVDGQNLKVVSQAELVAVLEPRVAEILALVKAEIDRHQLGRFLVSGFVITGGGSLLRGICDVATDILKVPARIGQPTDLEQFHQALQDPKYATGYGLLAFTIKKGNRHGINFDAPMVTRVFSRMKSWVLDFF
jgi:cell division protein FtsA